MCVCVCMETIVVDELIVGFNWVNPLVIIWIGKYNLVFSLSLLACLWPD